MKFLTSLVAAFGWLMLFCAAFFGYILFMVL